MAGARGPPPLGALAIGGWESLAIPPAPEAGDRWFKSNCTDSIAEGLLLVACARLLNAYRAGSIPASAAYERKGKPTGDGSCLENSRAKSLVSSTLTPSAVPLTERQRCQPSKRARRVQLPQGTLQIANAIPGSSLLVVMPGFESGVRRFD